MTVKNKVFVAGSINMDIVVRAQKHPMPGETVSGTELLYFPGGKGANQAIAAAKTGVQTVMSGKLGTDRFGDDLELFLNDQNVDTAFIDRIDEAGTGTALITVSETGENTIVVIPGANDLLTPADTDRVPLNKGDIVLSPFEIPLDTIEHTFTRGRKNGAKTILNPAPAKACRPDLLSLADILVLNETELAFFSKRNVSELSSIEDVTVTAQQFALSPEQVIIVTLGEKGAVMVNGQNSEVFPGEKVEVVDTTGAGDCFTGTLAARLCMSDNLKDAIHYANTAASLCVQSLGAGPSMPTMEEVDSIILGRATA